MILTNSTAAKVGANNVTAIASSTALFRQFMVYAATTLSSAITGATGLIKNGIGTLTLSGNNTYTGSTMISGGTLTVSNGYLTPSFTINSGAVLNLGYSPTASLTLLGNGTVNIVGVLGAIVPPLTISMGAGGLIDIKSTGGLSFGYGNDPWTGNLANLNVSGVLYAAANDVIVNTLTGNSTNFTVGAATIIVGVNNGGGTYTGTLARNYADGSFRKEGSGTQTMSGTMNLGATGTITQVGSGNLVINGAIWSGSIVQNGTGTLTLSGVNTYSGATTLNAGTLIVTGNIANSDLVIASGILSANTTAAVKRVDVKSLTVNGAATFACTVLSATAFTPGTNYDQINSAGAVTLNNTSGTPLTIAMYGTPTGWSNTGIYDFDIINAPSVVGFAANKLATDFTNFGILAASRTGTWIFSNPSLGIVRMRYAGVAISSFTWNTGTGNWGVAANWVDSAVVSQNAYISFTGAGGTSTNTVAQATLTTLFDITFSAAAGAYTLNSATGSSGSTGGTAMVVRGDVINNSANTQTIAFNYSILHNQIHSGNTTISGIISSTGGLIKDGAGTTLLLLGANTFTGGINVVNGTISLGSTGLLGNGTYAGAISNASALILGSNSNQTLSGVISGAGTLTKDGSGILALSGGNTHSGTITLNAGTLAVNSTGALGTCALVIAGGSLNNTSGSAKIHTGIGSQYWNADFTFIGTASLTLGPSGSGGDILMSSNRIVTVTANEFSIGSRLTGSGRSLTKNGAGTLTLAGSNLYSGGTIVNAGLLNINRATALGGAAAAPLTLSGGNIGCTHTIDLTLTYNHPQNWNADFSYTGGVRTLNLGTGTVTMNANRQVNIVSGGLTIGGNISNTYSLTKTGTGTLTLNGINTLSGGGLIVNAGTVNIGAQFGIPSAITLNSGSTLRLSNHNALTGCPSITVNSGCTLTSLAVANSAGYLFSTFSGALVVNNGTVNILPVITNGYVDSDFGAGSYTFSGTCAFNPSRITQGTTIFNVTSGTTTMTGGYISYELVGGLIKNGAGTLNLGTIVNFYRGTTVVNEGAIIVTRTTAGVTATATLTPTLLTVDFGGATPKLGTVFKFFPGATPTGLTLTLTNVGGGVVGSYNPASSSLSIGVTPDTTGLAAWFDATADGSLYSAATGGTSVTADGALVVRWEDISGNGAHLFNEHTVDRHPALKLNSINNKKGIRFNGDYLGRQNNNRFLRKLAPNSAFYYIVLKHNTLAQPGNGTTRIMNSTHYSAASGGIAQSLFFGSNTTEIRMRLNGVTCNVARPIDLAPFLVEFGRNASDGAKLYINGVDQNVYAGSFTPVTGTHINESGFFGGGAITTTETLIGDICEILLYTAPPSESARQAIETYLNNKWAIY